MSHATHIIDGKLGGTRKAAEILDLPPSTVQSWKDAGFIPAKRQQFVLDRSRDAGIDLAPEDFFDRESADQPAEETDPSVPHARGSAAA